MNKIFGNRSDLDLIADLITDHSKVLDVACGDAALLQYLQTNKFCQVSGIEIDEKNILNCLEKGIPIVKGDAETSLDSLSDHSFDFVILSNAIGVFKDPLKILNEAFRIGSHVFISFYNFAYWKNRCRLAFLGMVPKYERKDATWHNMSEIRHVSITDFVIFCRDNNIKVERAFAITSDCKIHNASNPGALANLFAKQALFLCSKTI